jgi:CheY-like chemotaxis protein
MAGRAKNLLLVDDDDQVRSVLGMVLSATGYTVRYARDGFSALAEIRHGLPDIILCDLYMPGMSGFELLSVVHRRFPSIRVVAMSGAYTGAGVPQGIAAEAFYSKGTEPKALMECLEVVSRPKADSVVALSAESMPLWLCSGGLGAKHALIACPECCRAFESILNDAASGISSMECQHCSQVIEYAVVQPAITKRQPAFLHTSEIDVPHLLRARA